MSYGVISNATFASFVLCTNLRILEFICLCVSPNKVMSRSFTLYACYMQMHTPSLIWLKKTTKKRAIVTIKSGEFSVLIHVKQTENEHEVSIKKIILRANDFDCLKYGLHNLNFRILQDYSSVITDLTMCI